MRIKETDRIKKKHTISQKQCNTQWNVQPVLWEGVLYTNLPVNNRRERNSICSPRGLAAWWSHDASRPPVFKFTQTPTCTLTHTNNRRRLRVGQPKRKAQTQHDPQHCYFTIPTDHLTPLTCSGVPESSRSLTVSGKLEDSSGLRASEGYCPILVLPIGKVGSQPSVVTSETKKSMWRPCKYAIWVGNRVCQHLDDVITTADYE